MVGWVLAVILPGCIGASGSSVSGAAISRGAVPVQFWFPGQGITHSIISTDRVPTRLLSTAGIILAQGDRLLWNGEDLALDVPLPDADSYTLQIQPSVSLSLMVDGQTRTITTTASTVGRALWDAGITLSAADSISLSPDAPPVNSSGVVLRRAVPLQIKTGDHQATIRSAAATVGQVLAEAGLSLQSLDYSQPGEEQPLPADGLIRVVRIREETVLEQKALPYDRNLTADATLELDQRRVIQAGQLGLQVTRVRIRYENGQQVSRTPEAQWVASLPQPESIGYGTQVVTRTVQTADGTISYWRAVNAYATSYYPCGFVNRCSYTTANGSHLQKGIAAVTLAWYRYMLGARIYVPGYGFAVIADNGGGIPGRYWIDLGYSNEDYQSWHSMVTVYFLTPVPDKILWILP